MKTGLKRAGVALLLAAGAAAGGWWWLEDDGRSMVEAAIPAEPTDQDATGPFADALAVATARAREGRNRLSGLVELGQLYHANGYLEEAQQVYEALLDLEPTNPRWPHLWAIILAGYGDLHQARELWRRTIDLAPDYLPARLRLADSAFKDNAIEEASVAYQEILERWREEPYALLGLARIDFEAGRWQEALTRLERVVALTEYRLGYDLIVDVYERLGRKADADAVRAKIKASGAFREAPDPWMEDLIRLCFDPYRIALAAGAQAEPAEARRLLLRAIELAPDEVSYRLQLSTLSMEQGNTSEALAQLTEMTRRWPTFADGWSRLALLQEQLGQHAAAARTIVDGLQQCPDSPTLHLKWGTTLRRAGRLAEAVPALQRSIELLPNESPAYVELAHVYVGLGDLSAGLSMLRRSVEVEPGNPAAITFLAFQAIAMADRAEADQWMAQVAQQPRVTPNAARVLRQNYARQFGEEWRNEGAGGSSP